MIDDRFCPAAFAAAADPDQLVCELEAELEAELARDPGSAGVFERLADALGSLGFDLAPAPGLAEDDLAELWSEPIACRRAHGPVGSTRLVVKFGVDDERVPWALAYLRTGWICPDCGAPLQQGNASVEVTGHGSAISPPVAVRVSLPPDIEVGRHLGIRSHLFEAVCSFCAACGGIWIDASTRRRFAAGWPDD